MLLDMIIKLLGLLFPQMFGELLCDVFYHAEHRVPEVSKDVPFLLALFGHFFRELV
jgi:hypothetical protein